MTSSVKAALLSGLVFPGVGHLVLNKYGRGALLVLSVLIAMTVIVIVSVKRAMPILDDIVSGRTPADPGSILAAVSNATAGTDNASITYAMIVIVVCWLFGIVDSYRIGSNADARGTSGQT